MKWYQQIFRLIFTIDFVAIVALLASLLFPFTWPVAMPGEFWIKQGVEYFLYGAFYFANLFFLYPRLSNKARGFFYIIAVCGCIFVIWSTVKMVSGTIGLNTAMIKAFSTPERPFRPNPHWENTWVIGVATIVLGLSYISASVKKMQKSQLAFEALERERVNAELSFLKAQINPHFFFNTLHTIYALMDTDQPAAKSSIYNLSHMMRYVIYDTRSDHTSLTKEIGFIEDYIALMKVRISEKVQIILDIQADIPDMEIAPMLLLPFIENAFKHGISAVHPSYIFIGMGTIGGTFRFEVRNSLFQELGKQLDDDQGIGVANTRRRLDLLYPGKYDLQIEREDFSKEHSITLTIQK